MNDANPYFVLGVGPDATPAEIRAAFREAVRQRHPDTATVPTDDAAVGDLIDAYRLLSDPAARAGYDASQSPKRRTTPTVRSGDVSSRSDRRRARSPGSPASCTVCRGIGIVSAITECPVCSGRAEITVLARSRSRILRCGTCRGTGRVASVERCPTCGGSGVAAAKGGS
jgi:DnaJ-class molecular chaperone